MVVCMVMTKTCTQCRETKLVDCFSPRSDKPGYKAACKSCVAAQDRAQYVPVKNVIAQVKYCECGAQRALGSKAECISCYRHRVTVKGSKERRRKGLNIGDAKRLAVYERDNYVCGICGTYVDTICNYNDEQAPTLDHIVPRSKGGSNDIDNLRTAHRSCNGRRGNRA